MEVILKADVDRLGKAGQKVNVKDGYGRNFLFPRGLAVPLTVGNRNRMNTEMAEQARLAQHTKQKASDLAERITAVVCTIPMAVGQQGKLYGSVTAQALVDALRKQGISVEKRQISLASSITQLGSITVLVKLHPEIIAHLQVNVVAKSS